MSVPNVSISPVHVWIVYPKTGRFLLHLLVVHDLNYGNIGPRWQRMVHHLFERWTNSKLNILKDKFSWGTFDFHLNPSHFNPIILFVTKLLFCSFSDKPRSVVVLILWIWWGFWIMEEFRIFKLDLVKSGFKDVAPTCTKITVFKIFSLSQRELSRWGLFNDFWELHEQYWVWWRKSHCIWRVVWWTLDWAVGGLRISLLLKLP